MRVALSVLLALILSGCDRDVACIPTERHGYQQRVVSVRLATTKLVPVAEYRCTDGEIVWW